MAIKLPDGRIMRTLPEQVDKNMQDIASINNEVNVIKESITTAYKIQGSATVADLNANTPDAAMNGYVYNMTDAGSLINSDETTTSVQIGDNVVLVWNEGNYFWDRLSGVVDTSNLVTLDSEQEITASKTFDEGIKIKCGINTYEFKHNTYNGLALLRQGITIASFGGSDFSTYSHIPQTHNTYNLGNANFMWKDLYLSGKVYGSNSGNTDVYKNNSLIFRFQPNGFASCNYLIPVNNERGDLGISSNKWRDIYLARNLTDGTNSVTVAEIIKKRTTITISHAPSTTGFNTRTVALTAEQLAALDTSKALILSNHYPDIALAAFISGSNLQVCIYEQGSTACEFDIFQ